MVGEMMGEAGLYLWASYPFCPQVSESFSFAGGFEQTDHSHLWYSSKTSEITMWTPSNAAKLA